MGLRILDESKITTDINTTVLGTNNGFCIRLCKNKFYEVNFDKYWKPTKQDNSNSKITQFQGIMLDNISFDLSTPWTEAGGAVIGKKFAGYTNSKFIKMFAGQSKDGFNPFICSDAWTQQKVGGDASPIKISLKFKAYNSDRLGCTNYNDIIKFLIQICSPMKSASYLSSMKKHSDGSYKDVYETEGIGTQTRQNIENAVDGVVSTASTIMNAGKNFMNLQKENKTEKDGSSTYDTALKNLSIAISTINNLYVDVITETANGKNNANFTVLFTLGDVSGTSNNAKKIRTRDLESSIINDEGNLQVSTSKIDWIVKSFNFKPSTEFFWVEKEQLPKPLWIDFDLTLETRLSLSNKYIYQLLND